MPLPQYDWDAQVENAYIAEHLNYNHEEERASTLLRIPELNVEQAEAYRRILKSVEHESGHLFFLSGPGGTGKTFVYNTVCNKVRSEGWIVLCVASSGIAALLLKGGRTAHSMFKIPVRSLHAQSACNIPKE
ncbi:PIF1-like helicase-domain-containing protein, partial [Sparassis latifolia]